jgi:hypothetical protein
LAVHATAMIWHIMVPVGAQPQEASSSVWGCGIGSVRSASPAGTSPASITAASAGPELAPPPTPLLPDEALAAQPHICSGTHVKPGPQSELTWHGRLYFGVHVPEVVVVHVGGGGGGQTAPEEQATPPPEHSADVDIAHPMPDAQSESRAQGASSQVSMTPGSHPGGGKHSSPFAHAGHAGQSDSPVTWHVNPRPQSASLEHNVDA